MFQANFRLLELNSYTLIYITDCSINIYTCSYIFNVLLFLLQKMSNVTYYPEETVTGSELTTEVSTAVANQVARFCHACVSQYLESRLSRWAWTYLSPVMIILGTLGNLLTLAVLNSKHNKASAINVALAFLAVADIAVLNVGLMHQWIRFVWGFDLRIMSNIGCKVHLTFTLFVMALSPNILALVTIDRVLSVLFPLKVKYWITKKRMICACVALTSFVFACHVPLFVAAYLDPRVPSYRMCQWHNPTFTKAWYWVSFTLDFLAPFTVIFTGNTLIMIRLTIAAARRSKSTQSDKGRLSSTTMMLVAVGVAYFITMTPQNVYRLGLAYGAWPNRPEPAYARLQLVIAVNFLLLYGNSAINFLLYCLAGSRFRSTLIMMFRGAKKEMKLPSIGTGTGTGMANVTGNGKGSTESPGDAIAGVSSVELAMSTSEEEK